MFVTYSPEDGDAQRWELDLSRVRESQAELIEKRFGGTWTEFKTALIQGGSRARRVTLWHLLTRDHHTLRYEDSPDPYKHELTVEFSRGELELIRAQTARMKGGNEDEREQALAYIDQLIEEAPVGSDSGKAGFLPDGFSG